MKKFYLIMLSSLIFSLLYSSSLFAQKNKTKLTNKDEIIVNCELCHADVAKNFEDEENVHKKGEMTCSDCHGGNSTIKEGLSEEQMKNFAHNKEKGFVGKPSGLAIVMLCGECHEDLSKMQQYGLPTDQLKEYRASGHGKRLFEDPANEDVPTCIDCHASTNTKHLIMSPKNNAASPVNKFNIPLTCGKCHGDNELMKKYGLEQNILSDYKESYHGRKLLNDRDSAVPSCADCHGNHGALPPNIGTIENVCGKCHVNTMANYKHSKHYKEIDVACMECHNNHKIHKTNIEMINPEKAVCRNCHEDDNGMKYAKLVYDKTMNISIEMQKLEKMLKIAHQKGFYVDDEKHDGKEAKRERVKALTQFHMFNWQEVEPSLNSVLSHIHKANDSLNLKFRKARDRKIGGIVFFIIISIFALVIFAKFRSATNKGIR